MYIRKAHNSGMWKINKNLKKFITDRSKKPKI